MYFIEECKKNNIQDIRVPVFSIKDRIALSLVVVNDIGTDEKYIMQITLASIAWPDRIR